MKDEPSPLFISTMKNEGPYIVEWLAYHRVIGFSQFLIYTNDCTDGTTDILDRLTALGLVQHEENIVLNRGPHKSALKHARKHPSVGAAEWIYVADIDEYLNIHLGNGTVQELIAAHPQADAIPITWRLFSHDDHIALQSPYLLEDFTDAERTLENGGQTKRFVKTLFRNDHRVERFGLHIPIVSEEHVDDFTWVAPDGRRLGPDENKSRPETGFGYSGAQVNHYAVRSLDGYLVKKDRGRANHFRHNLGSDYWKRMCRGGEKDTSIHRHIPAVRAEIARLLQDRSLADLHAASIAWHKEKVAELRKIAEFESLRIELMALSEAKDHQRDQAARLALEANSDPSLDIAALLTEKQPMTAEKDNLGRDPKALIAVLRASIQDIEPLETNLVATGLINKLEDIYNRKP